MNKGRIGGTGGNVQKEGLKRIQEKMQERTTPNIHQRKRLEKRIREKKRTIYRVRRLIVRNRSPRARRAAFIINATVQR